LVLYVMSIEVLKERFDGRLLFGLVAGLLGSVLILGAPLIGGEGDRRHLLGILFIILAVLTDVTGTILIKPALRSLPVMQMTAVRFIIAALVFVPLWLADAPPVDIGAFTTGTWLSIAYNLIFSTLISFYLYHWSLMRLSAEQTTPLTYLDPTVGAVGSIIFLGEQATITMLIGTALVVTGLYIGERRQRTVARHISHHR
jgi:drug/metabolite transporter (DMT)-like permease